MFQQDKKLNIIITKEINNKIKKEIFHLKEEYLKKVENFQLKNFHQKNKN